MEELRNYLKLYSKWKDIKKDSYSIELLKKNGKLKEHLKDVEEYEKEVMNGEIYESEKKILLSLIENYKKSLTDKSFVENLDALEILFFLSSFSAVGVISLALQKYFEKVNRNELIKAV